MTVLMFHKMFAPPIVAGTKTHTIRPQRKRPVKVGEDLSLRVWDDVAYRSPQVTLLDTKCIGTFYVTVGKHGLRIGMSKFQDVRRELDHFAVTDGFQDWAHLIEWYLSPDGYGLPFSGVLIQWGKAN